MSDLGPFAKNPVFSPIYNLPVPCGPLNPTAIHPAREVITIHSLFLTDEFTPYKVTHMLFFVFGKLLVVPPTDQMLLVSTTDSASCACVSSTLWKTNLAEAGQVGDVAHLRVRRAVPSGRVCGFLAVDLVVEGGVRGFSQRSSLLKRLGGGRAAYLGPSFDAIFDHEPLGHRC